MLVACLVGLLVSRFAHLPYTIALTLVGLGLGISRFGPGAGDIRLSHDLVFFVILPPLLFQGALHLQLGRLLQHFWPILSYASVGVLISTFFLGAIFYWVGDVQSLLIAILFGAMMAPTDPVSVIAIFKQIGVPKDLKYLIEGESLFNDGTGVVVFAIVLELIVTGNEFSLPGASATFLKVTLGGTALGLVLGGAAFLLLRPLKDKLLENAFCLVLAYGSFWLGEALHLSGVITTVISGLLIGNYGKRFSMSRKTVETVDTFFESLDFLINSLLFVLIGLELRSIGRSELLDNFRPLIVAIVAMLASRAIAIYSLHHLLNLRGRVRPLAYAHVMWWGGLRGSIPIALLLGLPDALDPYRSTLLVAGFGCVFFSLVVQGITMKPLLRWLGIKADAHEGELEDLPPAPP